MSTRPTVPESLASAPAAARFGKFIRAEKLGAGGMGEVWKAWDGDLGRWVALKFLKGGLFDDSGREAEELARFRREAQLAAGLSHPNITAIYEIGEQERRPWIAMQFVEGTTAATLRGGDPRRCVEVIATAARAVAFAHERGVIHRDLKPENLMVAGDKVFVTDFGLARAAGTDSTLTQSGFVVGTPSYMPPEQARGDRVDERADVYSLGATLYDLLSGRPPAEGTTPFEILVRVIDREPPPLRRLAPKVDKELESVVARSLEKEPSMRYASAAEFAEELERWLAGEPVRARPPGIAERLGRTLRRRRAIVAVVAASAVLLGGAVAASVFLQGRASSAKRAVVERMRRTTDDCIEAALSLRRAGEVRRMLEVAARAEEACAEVERDLPALAEPHVRRGRLYRAQMRFPEALAEQEKALLKDPASAEAAYERIVLNTRRFFERLHESGEEEWRAVGERMAREGRGEVRATAARGVTGSLERQERDLPMQKLIAAIRRDLSTINAANLGPAPVLCARGLAAWVAADGPRAWEELGRALEIDPLLNEAHEARAKVAWTMDRLDLAIEAWSRGLATDRGYTPYLEGRGEVRAKAAHDAMDAGRDPSEHFAPAIADYTEAVRLHPARAEAWMLRGAARVNWGLWRMWSGADPLPLLEEAVGDLDEALRREPDSTLSWIYRGNARLNRGTALSGRGEDAAEAFEAAARDYGGALERDPNVHEAWAGRATARLNLAEQARRRGRDAGPYVAEAMSDFAESLRRNPGRAETWSRRSDALYNEALFTEERGGDPTALLEKAIEDQTHALTLRESDWESYMTLSKSRVRLARVRNDDALFERAMKDAAEALTRSPGSGAWAERGAARVEWARGRLAAGRESRALFDEGLADFTEAIRRNPERDATWLSRATARMNYGLTLAIRGGDPEPLYQAAVADLDQALKLRPGHGQLLSSRGAVRVNWGFWRAERGRVAEDLFQAAIRDFDEALRQNPRSAETLLWRGRAWGNRALSLRDGGGEASGAFRSAIEDFTSALAIEPGNIDALVRRADARSMWALGLTRRGTDPSGLLHEAEADFEAAIRVNASYAEAWLLRGGMRVNWGAFTGRTGGDASGLLRSAIVDLTEAIRLDPANDQAWLFRGNAWMSYSNYVSSEEGRAFADYGEALKRNPGNDGLRMTIATARSGAGLNAAARGEDPTAHYREAIETLTELVTRNPAYPEPWIQRGAVRVNWGLWRSRGGEDPMELYGAALADFAKALERQPSAILALRFRANAHFNIAAWRELKGGEGKDSYRAALADLEALVKQNPGLEPQVRGMMEQCRGKVK